MGYLIPSSPLRTSKLACGRDDMMTDAGETVPIFLLEDPGLISTIQDLPQSA